MRPADVTWSRVIVPPVSASSQAFCSEAERAPLSPCADSQICPSSETCSGPGTRPRLTSGSCGMPGKLGQMVRRILSASRRRGCHTRGRTLRPVETDSRICCKTHRSSHELPNSLHARPVCPKKSVRIIKLVVGDYVLPCSLGGIKRAGDCTVAGVRAWS